MVRQEEWKKNRTKDKLFRAAQPVYTRKKRKRPESERQIPEEESGEKKSTKKKNSEEYRTGHAHLSLDLVTLLGACHSWRDQASLSELLVRSVLASHILGTGYMPWYHAIRPRRKSK